ncbi:integrase core domain-containing protein [Proteus genomosp. 4]|uniref:integrase core domain-containing protein n=1 Tax=Proteus genomosp. 4 TaxID=1311818 RepID=UPI000D688DB4|nr:integrase core domain-containing protein [Proteus genomosp. 4]
MSKYHVIATKKPKDRDYKRIGGKKKVLAIGIYPMIILAKARKLVRELIQFYNERRPHLSLNYKMPDEVY